MHILVAYKGLCESNRTVKKLDEQFSFMDVMDNHKKFIYEPLKRFGKLSFALCGNESDTMVKACTELEPVYVSTSGNDQLQRTITVLENVPDYITHVVLLRFDMVFKCKITECHIKWDSFNFPWIAKHRKLVQNGDTLFIFPANMTQHVVSSCKRLHTCFQMSDVKMPHLHGFYRRCMKKTGLPINSLMSGWYNSNTCDSQNPLFQLYRSIYCNVPLNQVVMNAVKIIVKRS